MAETITIDRNNSLLPSEDYDFLRKQGIGLIQDLSGKVWTDYNTHDPGITLLEMLCYGLTDVGYRTSFDIKDILASKNTTATSWQNIFYTARQVLPCNAVTLTDYRKIIIDIEGVRNAWIEISDEAEMTMYLQHEESAEDPLQKKYSLTSDAQTGDEVLRLRGLYKVFVQYEDEILQSRKEEEVAEKIKNKLFSHRNLCEDFISVSSVDEELFRIEAEVVVSEGTDIEKINASIYSVIHDFLSPAITFYSLEQMLERGSAPEEIFEGPLLKHGFIDTADLQNSERFKDIHMSDIMRIVSGIEGVIAIKKLVLPLDIKSSFTDFTQWFNNVKDKQKVAKLDIENSEITFARSGDRHRNATEKQPDKKRVKAIFTFLQSSRFKSRLQEQSKDLQIAAGEFMNIAEYYPIQKSLPANYGMMETYIDTVLDERTIKNAVTEILDYKGGVFMRELLNRLIAAKPDDAALRDVLIQLTDSATDELMSEIIIHSIINETAYEADIKKIIKQLLPQQTGFAQEKEMVFDLMEKQKKQSRKLSEKTIALQEISRQAVNKTLFEIVHTEDIDKIKEGYQKLQINRLENTKKQKLQLRGFLMVFEQILADYLSQLQSVKQIFSFDNTVGQTYFPQALENISDLESLFINYKKYTQSYVRQYENEEKFTSRRNKILDHLLGRFSEDMSKYAYFVQSAKGKMSGKILIEDKTRFLSDYIQISNYRGKAFNYNDSGEIWDSNNVAGIKKRICRMLGIKEYSTKFIASDSIRIEKTAPDDKIVRYIVVLSDPQNKEHILLESIEYEFESEAREILNYILTAGFNEHLYIKEGHKDKWSYQLKRPTQEDDYEVVAGKYFNNKQHWETAFAKTIETIKTFSEEENFHLIEHILLRPKVPFRQKSGKKINTIDSDSVDLLLVNDVDGKDAPAIKKHEGVTYKFKIINVKNDNKKNKTTWKLSLLKDDNTEILIVEEDFVFYKHLTRRIEQLRQFAADNINYFIDQNADGYYIASIKDEERNLAVSKKNYKVKEDLDAEIVSLVNFFSYERGMISDKDENYDDISFYADPYSLQVSIIIPDGPEKFRNPTFKHLLEKTIYLEMPSHIYAHVYWLDHISLRQFEEAYKLWLEELPGQEIPNTEIVNNFISQLNDLRK